MQITKTIFGSLFILILLFTACNSVTPKQKIATKETFEISYDTTQKYHSKLDKIFQTWHKNMRFNGNILVAKNGVILYENALGWADYRKKDSLKINSAFQLASVSKQFTAIAILQLVAEGKLQLTDTVSNFFDDFPYENVTIHQMLCHRSGLPKYMFFCDEFTDNSVPVDFSFLQKCIQKHKPGRNYLPNSRFQYNNTNYVLLAAIIEKVSGMKFPKYMQTHIFDPLKMTETRIFDLKFHGGKPTDLTFGYNFRWHKIEPDFLDGIAGDKGVYTTVEDMLRWDQSLYSGAILDTQYIQLAFQPHGRRTKKPDNYGYGFRMRETPDKRKLIYHGGWWHGYNTLFIRDIEKHNTVVILANKRNRTLRALADTVLSIIEPIQIQHPDSLFATTHEKKEDTLQNLK